MTLAARRATAIMLGPRYLLCRRGARDSAAEPRGLPYCRVGMGSTVSCCHLAGSRAGLRLLPLQTDGQLKHHQPDHQHCSGDATHQRRAYTPAPDPKSCGVNNAVTRPQTAALRPCYRQSGVGLHPSGQVCPAQSTRLTRDLATRLEQHQRGNAANAELIRKTRLRLSVDLH